MYIFRAQAPSKRLDAYFNIEFLTWPITRYKREVLFGWVDLLVSFGGIAGLFLGFSLFSCIEIIFYFTLRTWCMLHKNRVGVNCVTKTVLNRILCYSIHCFFHLIFELYSQLVWTGRVAWNRSEKVNAITETYWFIIEIIKIHQWC